jgi:hypothetical protein
MTAELSGAVGRVLRDQDELVESQGERLLVAACRDGHDSVTRKSDLDLEAQRLNGE